MTSRVIAIGILKSVGALVAIALLLYLLFQIQTIIVYLVVALITTLIGNPILDFFKNRLKFNHLLATIATISFFVLLLLGLISMAAGEKFSKKHGTKLMSLRIAMQSLAILSLVFAYFLWSN
jgi:predicted PurR-regulated permease PerM